MTSEHDYEEWYQKYLGDIESVLDYEPERSPYTNTPKPFSQRKMLIWCTVLIFLSLLGSFFCSLSYESFHHWILSWFSNIFLSFSIGLVASIVLLIFTTIKDRNSAFYSDIIPDLERKHQNMQDAYFQYCNKISIYFQQQNFNECYDSWRIASNTSFVILDFLEYLEKVLPYRPKCLTLAQSDIEEAKNNISIANSQIESEYIKDFHISKETADACDKAIFPASTALTAIQALIEEFKQTRYELQYGQKNISKIEELKKN